MRNLLDVRELTVELPTPVGWVRPVNGVSLHIAAGESLGLVGESGSGKTMLALALMGLLPPGARVTGEAQFTAEKPGGLGRARMARRALLLIPRPGPLGLVAALPEIPQSKRKSPRNFGGFFAMKCV